MGYLESLQLFYTPNNELEKSIKIHQQGFEVVTTTTHYFYDAFGRRIGKSSSTQKSSKLNQRGQLVRFPSNLSSLNTTDRPQRKNTLMLWDGNRQIQEYTDEQIFTTVYEQNSFEPVARIVQLASHIEQKRLADIAYETRRFVRIGESEETISQRIADNSKPLINIYHYHCNHLGTPQELTNQDGDVIWLSYDRAWGGSFDTIYKRQFIDNFSLKENELQPIKFQGQSLDVETGLHYNRFRYYDSDVGMFISRDPIGLMGGSNVFQYAPNPIGWIDPWGLNRFTKTTWQAPKRGTNQNYTVFQQPIDWDMVDDKGRTNLQRTARGRAPLGSDGLPLNLHHSNQDSRGALFEVTESTHRKYGYTNALHPYKVDGTGQHPHFPVDRDAFDKDREKYWRERGKAERKRRRAAAKGKC